MNAATLTLHDGGPLLTTADLRKIGTLVYTHSGIALRADTKRAMVVARLQKRLRQGGFSTFADYLRYVERDRSGQELTALLDAITTNLTTFFREPSHFDFLANTVVPPLMASQTSRPIIGWSAACATGEEAYSMAVTLLDCVPLDGHSRIRVLASDLSTRAIETARAGVYPLERVTHIARGTLRKHFERGLHDQQGLVRVKRSVRDLIEFRRLNLLESDDIGVLFDFIFCRNVMIYFDLAARQRLVSILERHLRPRGYLFISHSENLSEVDQSLQRCAPGVYQRGEA